MELIVAVCQEVRGNGDALAFDDKDSGNEEDPYEACGGAVADVCSDSIPSNKLEMLGRGDTSLPHSVTVTVTTLAESTV